VGVRYNPSRNCQKGENRAIDCAHIPWHCIDVIFGPDKDIPAPDYGYRSSRDMAGLMDEYSKATWHDGEFQ